MSEFYADVESDNENKVEKKNITYIFGKYIGNMFEEKEDIWCNKRIFSDEKKDIDYDSFFNNKVYVNKGNLLLLNIIHNVDFSKDIDVNFIEEIKKRFPSIFEKKNKAEKFWSKIIFYTEYSIEFYNRYKDELGIQGFFNIKDLTSDYIIENKDLFDTKYNFMQIIQRQQKKEVLIAFSDFYIKYFPIYVNDNKDDLIWDFFAKQWLDLDFVEKLIKEYGWGDIYKYFLDNINNFEPSYYFYGIDLTNIDLDYDELCEAEDHIIKKLKELTQT
tara:strand:- start:384 stop:1202 length:819 start_codon:yes stop_codon:yes gene_type:complete